MRTPNATEHHLSCDNEFLPVGPGNSRSQEIMDSAVVARPKRFELLTPRFVVWCSIQLSYGRF